MCPFTINTDAFRVITHTFIKFFSVVTLLGLFVPNVHAQVDFGDAPDPLYPTLLVNDGARHTIVGGSPVLGAVPSSEADGQPNATATGDAGDVTPTWTVAGFTVTELAWGESTTANFTVSDAPGFLNAWIDYNADGDWDDPGEQIFTDEGVIIGANNLVFTPPALSGQITTFIRFRVDSAGGLSPTGLAADGEVEDYEITISGLDFGDAPDPLYPTLRASGGARAHGVGTIRMGTLWDSEADGQPNATASGDDVASTDDEDGVVFGQIISGIASQATVNVTGGPGFINAWIDFNDDGDWSDPGEQIFTDQAVVNGNNILGFTPPSGATDSFSTFARFRITSAAGAGITGFTPSGEVEDYEVTILVLDFGDAPDPTFPTLLANNGARHFKGGPQLGATFDAESNGQPNATATGDGADEDGVTFGPLAWGEPTKAFVTVSGAVGKLNAWIDFNDDGDWNDVGEQIATDVNLALGVNEVLFTPPAGTAPLDVISRFRISTVGGDSFVGAAADGEVEDYEITISGLDFGDASDPTFPTLRASNGARHIVSPSLYLGAVPPDAEVNGQPSLDALGDDATLPKPTSVVFNSIIHGELSSVDVTVGGSPGFINAWVDFNVDGDWNDVGEHILVDAAVAIGVNVLTFTPPALGLTTKPMWRFRLNSTGGLAATGLALDGEVEDYSHEVRSLDFGDAPDPTYPTLRASNGARHADELSPTPLRFSDFLTDTEADGLQNATATGDDVSNTGTPPDPDEDGITLGPLVAGEISPLTVNIKGHAGLMNAWIDYNNDGDWADAGEQIFTDQAVVVGDNVLPFTPLANAVTDQTVFARFRVSTLGGDSYTGLAQDGEVIDLTTTIQNVDYGDAPDPSYPTLRTSNGGRHRLGSTLFMGTAPDGDSPGHQSANADGDDTNDNADEDGVIFNSTFVRTLSTATSTTIFVDASEAGFLDAWIDWNRDGDWLDVGEQIAASTPLVAGNNLIPITVAATNPNPVNPGLTFLRLRVSSTGGLAPTGLALDGEIEDHPITIIDGSVPYDFGLFSPNVGGSITITRAGGLVTFTHGTFGVLATTPITNLNQLTIPGTNNTDTFVVNFAGGNPIPAGGMSVDGVAGANDALHLVGGSTDTVTHTFLNETDGSVVFSGGLILGTIDYVNLDPIVDGVTKVNEVFNFTNGAETIVLEDNGIGGDGIGFIDSDFAESVTFNVPTSSITVNSVVAGGSDITLRLVDSAYAGTISINGDATGTTDLLVDFSNGNPASTGQVNWDGGLVGAGGLLNIDNGSGFTTIAFDMTGAYAGTIDIDGADITYINTDIINEDIGAVNRLFEFPATADLYRVWDSSLNSDGTSELISATAQSIFFRNPTSSLTINGRGGNDHLEMLKLDGAYSGSFTFNGGDDNDTFEPSWINGSPLQGVAVVYNGSAGGTNNDDMILTDGPGIASVTHNFTNATDGTVVVNGLSMAYTGLEPIDDNLTAGIRTFNFAATADAIFLVTEAGGTDSEISSTASSETVTFDYTGTTQVTINGAGGDDTFDIQSSDKYPITVNGQSETTADTFELNSASLTGNTIITLIEIDYENGTYHFDSGHFPVTYTDMEVVKMRFHDPYAFPLATYPGEFMYPLLSESGISIEPYFNWDIDLMLAGPAPSVPTSLDLEVASDNAFASIVFATDKWMDGTPLVSKTGADDHYITDVDRQPQDAGIPLLSFTDYFWRLSATLTSGDTFRQEQTFQTVFDLDATLTYPSEGLVLHELDKDMAWNIGGLRSPSVYFRVEMDRAPKVAFDGASPSELGGDLENDNDTAVADGYTKNTLFRSADLPSPIVNGFVYSWRVTTLWPVPPTGWVPQEIFDKNETDRMVGISPVGQFFTTTAAYVPVLTYPVNNLVIYTSTPKVSWNVAAPFAGLTFTVEIKESGGPLVCTSVQTGLQFDTANCITPLEAGKTYEWRVKSFDGTSTFAFSAYESFSVVGAGFASAATLSYPVDELEIYTTAPTFSWFTGSANVGLSFVAWYKERVGPAETLCTGVKAGGTSLPSVGVTQVDVSGLKPGATYDWCVVTTGTNGSVDSAVDDFSVAGGMGDGIPNASWPIGNPTTYTLDQQLDWFVSGATLGITGYTVEYCISPAMFGGACTVVGPQAATKYTITGLDYGDMVTWRVKASYSSGSDSDWSNPISQGAFTVTGSLATISATLTYPVDGLIVYSQNVDFNWHLSGATLPNGLVIYEVQFSYAEAFPAIGNITRTELTFDTHLNVSDLIPGHTYWWRVRVSTDGGSTFGAYSTVASFEIAPEASAVMPRIGSPNNRVTLLSGTPTLSWVLPTLSTSVLTYDVYLGQKADLSDAVLYGGLSEARYRVPQLKEGEYYWAVRSHSSNGTTSALSPIGTFRVGNGVFSTGIEVVKDASSSGMDNGMDSGDDDSSLEGGEDSADVLDPNKPQQDATIPSEYNLAQNYPNPFNPTTTIEFSLRQSTGVTIRIYNVLGQMVKTLVDGTLSAGVHRVTWDARNDVGGAVPTGLYLYRMETAEFADTKTLILMK